MSTTLTTTRSPTTQACSGPSRSPPWMAWTARSASLAELAGSAPRRYRLVVLSDHGQSQGTPFADRYGQALGDLCAELMQEHVQNVDASVEGLGRADSIAGDIATGGIVREARRPRRQGADQGTADAGTADFRPRRRARIRWSCWARATWAWSTCGVTGAGRLQALEQSVAGPGPWPGGPSRRRVRRRHR